MKQAWQGRTDGNRWMQQQLIRCFRFLHLRIYYAGVSVVVLFYMLLAPGFRPSYRFYRRRLQQGRLRALRSSYLNHYRFGQVIIDRFACYAGLHFDIEVEHKARFQQLADGPDAFVMLSAHVGNYELAGYSLAFSTKTLHALVFAGETATVMENRRIQFGRTHIEMIPLRDDLSHLFRLNNAIVEGDVVSLPADRCHGSEKSVECSFFGAPAHFPLGPFALIDGRRLPALAVFVMKEDVRRYRLFVEQLSLPTADRPRAERIRHLAQQYATLLETYVRRYPEQWFNFYDFWARPSSSFAHSPRHD